MRTRDCAFNVYPIWLGDLLLDYTQMEDGELNLSSEIVDVYTQGVAKEIWFTAGLALAAMPGLTSI